MQGGGSLGAYEAGVFRGLYEKLSNEDRRNGMPEKPLFDLVAGTSIGAINAAIVTSYVIDKGTWEGSADWLEKFWHYVTTDSVVDLTFGFKSWWDYYHSLNPNVATGEAARRYYSTKEFAARGVPNVFTPPAQIGDDRFFDPLNTWYQYDNNPLRKSIERFAKFPIGTDKNQPRLLVVAVDIQRGESVTFDSYPKADGSRWTEVMGQKNSADRGGVNHRHPHPSDEEQQQQQEEEGEKQFDYVIRYDKGITLDHVMASASVPLAYGHTLIEAERLSNGPKSAGRSGRSNNYNSNITRYFWDGDLLSNTPLREAISSHKLFWEEEIGYQNLLNDIIEARDENQKGWKVPSLDIYVANVWPSREQHIPRDYDGLKDRRNDIRQHDKTIYDQKVAVLVTDYIDLIKVLIKEAKAAGLKRDSIAKILENDAKSKQRNGSPRKFRDLLVGRFDISNVTRIERQDDIDAISEKWLEHSRQTMEHLREEGYRDALETQAELPRHLEKRY